MDQQQLKEACGICAVSNHPEAARLTYLGLYALQHRGQESAGIVSSDSQQLYAYVNTGLVADVFTPTSLDNLPGSMAIGHVRYSTAGKSAFRDAQPIMVNTAKGRLAIAHNGNLTNGIALRQELERKGSIFQTTADSEVILHLIARSPNRNLERAIADSLKRVRGAYSLLIATKREIFAVRDPWGFHPLILGRKGMAWMVASETSALDLVGFRYIDEVNPGEMVIFSKGGMSRRRIFPKRKHTNLCIFELVYFARPDSLVFGNSVYKVRREFGRQLAREAAVEADLVMPVPDSATVTAIGYAEQSGIPYEMGFIRSHYVGRTFIEPKQSIRDFGAKIKYNAIREVLRGKRVIVVDDSIVRGTTSRKLVKMLRRAGVRTIHLRISSPPITHPCFYGIDTPTRKELIASTHSVKEIQDYLGVDSLHYLSLQGMVAATERAEADFCLACFTGKYPVDGMKK